MKNIETKLNSKVVYDGKIMRVELDEVQLPDGRTSKREVVRHSGGAAALFVKEGKIALVRQFRYAYGKEMYEIPAGKLNPQEDPRTAAMRELEEETGYRADGCQHLLDIYPSPGYTDEIISIYFVKSARFVGQHLDDGEFLNCSFVDIQEVSDMMEKGQINDAKTVAAVYKYLLFKK